MHVVYIGKGFQGKILCEGRTDERRKVTEGVGVNQRRV